MNVVVFSGPTLSRVEVADLKNVIFLPPARQGDILYAVATLKADVIAIIDGYTQEDLPAFHKEFLYALSQGVKLYGAANVGALRAVELEKFGMIGVGKTFAELKACEISDDDEVLYCYSRQVDGYLQESEAMVNLRATFRKMLEAGSLSHDLYNKLLSTAKSLYYPMRNIDAVLSKTVAADLNAEKIAKIKDSYAVNYVNQQKNDALLMMEEIRKIDYTRSDASLPSFPSPGTTFNALYNRYRMVSCENFTFPLYLIINNMLINHPDFCSIRDRAFNRRLAFLFAKSLGVEVTENELNEGIRWFRIEKQIEAPQAFQSWLAMNDLSEGEFIQLVSEQTLLHKMYNWLVTRNAMEKNGKTLLDLLRLTGEFPEWKKKTANREMELSKIPDKTIGQFSQKELKVLLAFYLANNKDSHSHGFLKRPVSVGMDLNQFKYEMAKEDALLMHYKERLMNLFTS